MLFVAWSHLDLSDLGKIIQEQLLSEESAIHKGSETGETAILDHAHNESRISSKSARFTKGLIASSQTIEVL